MDVCEECTKRDACFYCEDCKQSMCFNCTDAIHIIATMAVHVIRPLQRGDVGYCAVPRTDLGQVATRVPPAALLILNPHGFLYGQRVCFRDQDIGRGLLFGLAITKQNDQPRMGSGNAQYVRVLWMRGVYPLPNQTYMAALTFSSNHWPIRIEAFVSIYHAFRATVLGEKILRGLWRREKYAGRLRKLRDQKAFPSEEILQEALIQIEKGMVTATAQFMIDEHFLASIVTGPLRTEGDEAEPESDAPYPPWTRVRLVLCPADALLYPKDVAAKQLTNVVHHMVDLYIGYAWKRWCQWVDYCKEQDHLAFLNKKAIVIQQWFCYLREKAIEAHNSLRRASGMNAMDVMQVFRLRQKSIAMMESIWHKTLLRLKKRGMSSWSQAIKRLAATNHIENISSVPWHPALGIKLLKLPKVHAYMKTDGSLGVEDITKYKQFRLNHSGPTACSYWIVRERVLVGQYPFGAAFPEKKRKQTDKQRIAPRSDSISCILLEQIGSFVCLMDRIELSNFEASLDAEERDGFEVLLRQRHAKLTAELEKAVIAAQKYVNSAAKTLLQANQDANTEDFVRDLLTKKKAAAESNLATALENQRKLQPLQVIYAPIEKNESSSESNLLQILNTLEDRLRNGENLYLFSHQGRGRAGMLAALLLGRLYGLTAQQALERTQRCHDCQRRYANLPSTRLISAPEALGQIRMVHQILSMTETIYEPLMTTDGDEYIVVRHQRRGVAVQTFANTKGFMVDEFPSSSQMATDHAEILKANRIALKEKRALQLRTRRAMEGVERVTMAMEEEWSRNELPTWNEILEMRAQDVECKLRWYLIQLFLEQSKMAEEDIRIKWECDRYLDEMRDMAKEDIRIEIHRSDVEDVHRNDMNRR
ncbi:hypothetical protein THRCLA_02632 [Thraustotheca clavata]|uniref:B box-type domain-containing protein n=1 Tax=Thraustotheca clavata TaxID=74557 RepID=A0A1W0A589_9STRA|nr:hypothetical protein THRCLA_02632 [Thraustotheca clavata]